MLLSVIIPCYKEEKDIERNVTILHNFLLSNNIDAEIICVSDGSPDNTFPIIKKIPFVKGIGYKDNKGKGGAIKYGIEHATGEYILYMDADLSTDLNGIIELQKHINKFDIIIGSRHTHGSIIKVRQPLQRRIIGKICRMLVNLKFRFGLKDTQCGFKAIKKKCALKIIELQRIDDFAFDIEYLYIAKLLKMTTVEIPVIWSDDRGSTVSPIKSSIRFLKDLRKIKKNKIHYLSKERQ